MSCSVNYSGIPSPTIEWLKRDRIKNSWTELKEISSRMFSLKTKGNLVIDADDIGVLFNCRAYFESSNSDQHFRQYTDLCDVTLNIAYGVKNIRVTPLSKVYKAGDILQCSAEGNPSPSYEWSEIGAPNNARITRDSYLRIEEKMTSGRNYTFQCTAINIVAGEENSAALQMTFTVAVEGDIGTSFPFGYILAGIAGIVLTSSFFLIYKCIIRGCREKRMLTSTDQGRGSPSNCDQQREASLPSSHSYESVIEDPQLSFETSVNRHESIEPEVEEIANTYNSLSERQFVQTPIFYWKLNAISRRPATDEIRFPLDANTASPYINNENTERSYYNIRY